MSGKSRGPGFDQLTAEAIVHLGSQVLVAHGSLPPRSLRVLIGLSVGLAFDAGHPMTGTTLPYVHGTDCNLCCVVGLRRGAAHGAFEALVGRGGSTFG